MTPMFAKTLIAAATAATIAVGALGATTTIASAQGYGPGGWGAPGSGSPGYGHGAPGYPDGPGAWHAPGTGYWGAPRGGGYFGGPNWRVAVRPPVRQVCAPTFRTIKIFRPYYGWVFTQVYAGQQCYWRAAW
jgi:hypothetical protein